MKTEEKRELDLVHIAPYNSKGTQGWLVRFGYYPDKHSRKKKPHSKLFSFNKHGGEEGALQAARNYRNQWLQKNGDKLHLKDGYRFELHLPKNNTSGIQGINRTVASKPSRTGFISEKWQTKIHHPDGKIKNTAYSVHKYGELNALCMAIETRKECFEQFRLLPEHKGDKNLIELINYYTDILSNLKDMKDYSEAPSILEIVKEPDTPATTKYEQILTRIGQQRFRREVLEFFDQKCAVTGSHILIRASHIKPWRISNDTERLDKMNGLALSPTYDAAFDAGVISFRNDGYIMIADSFFEEAELLFICESDRIQKISDGHARYLDWHRKNIFNKKGEPEA